MIKPRKPRVQKIYPKFENNYTQEKDFDILLFGVTGQTGKNCAIYLSNTYKDQIKWGVVGRNEQRIKAITDSLSHKTDIFIADSNDADSLKPLIARTKVVLTTVGPYDKYGTNIVALCAANGTHYVDITGELAWVRQMIEQYDAQACQTGAKILNMCGFDAIPWDLLTFKGNEAIQKENQTLKRIQFYDHMQGQISSGTFKTIMHSLSSVPPKTALGFDPLHKALGEERKISKSLKKSIQIWPKYDFSIGKWVGMWANANVNYGLIKRSQNLIDDWPDRFIYEEKLEFENFMAIFNYYVPFLFFGTLLANSWFQQFIQDKIVQAKSHYMSKEELDDGFAVISAIAHGDKGLKKKLRLGMFSDPGYSETAKMSAETAITLVLHDKELKDKKGFMTPAACLNDILLKRLITMGWTFEELE